MKKQDLYNYLMEELEIESVDSIDENTNLKDLEEWDSMGVMILISFADENFGKKLTNEDIKEKINTVSDFIDVIGREKFE